MASGSPSSLFVMRDTRAWQFQVWVSFGLAVFLCATGLAYLPGQALHRALMLMGYVFCLSTVFVLAKAVLDTQKARPPRSGPDREPSRSSSGAMTWHALVASSPTSGPWSRWS